MTKRKSNPVISLMRHESHCSICAHAQRDDIEQEFVNWTSPTRIAKGYNISRDAIYRHASAIGLFAKRQKNIRSALEKIIEQSGEVDVNAAAVVAAIQAYSKINAQGQWVERSETLSFNELFDRMTREELERYAQDGSLPDWFPKPQQEAKENAS
jgi:Zn-dependent peptidase ImmA (M78 family)